MSSYNACFLRVNSPEKKSFFAKVSLVQEEHTGMGNQG
ncbi:MAG: hypothetical protein ACJAYK_000712 [Crocinitomicaceae bacterium]|jgi:hypothetical protein